MDLFKADAESCPLKEQTKTNDNQNKSDIKDINDKRCSQSICSPHSPNKKYFAPDGSLHTTNTHDVAEKRIDYKNYGKIILLF